MINWNPSLIFAVVSLIISVIALIISQKKYKVQKNSSKFQISTKKEQKDKKEMGDKTESVVKWLLSKKLIISILGTACIVFPVIYANIINNSKLLNKGIVNNIMALGVSILFLGICLFGIEKRTNLKVSAYIIKASIYIIFPFLVIHFEGIKGVISGILLATVLLNDVVGIICWIYINKFKTITEEKIKISIVLAIVATIISLIFKIDIKF